MRGRGFISPLTALMIPIMKRTKITMPSASVMIPPTTGIAPIMEPKIPQIMSTRKRTSPWFI